MEPAFAAMMRSLATILLIVHMILGFFVWSRSRDYADSRLRVIGLSFVIIVAFILLFIIFLTGRYQA